VLGIVASDGVAVGIPGIALANMDAEKLRLEQVLANGLGPRAIKGIFQRDDGVIQGLRKESIFRSWIFPADESSGCTAAPHLARDTRGKPRVDDRRVISGIILSLASGCRSKDAPTVYGPRKTLYNRVQRWAAKGVWVDVFHALASAGGPPEEVLIDFRRPPRYRRGPSRRPRHLHARAARRDGRCEQVSVNLDGFVNYVPDGGNGASSYVQLLLKRLYGAVRSGWSFNWHSRWAGSDSAERMVAAYLGRRGTRL
jgi:transposase